MARHREDLGAREHVRVDLHKPGFFDPGAGCAMDRVYDHRCSNSGACLDVGALAVPELFGLAFTAGGEVFRVCLLAWRRGELIGARFVTAKELRQGLEPKDDKADPKLQKAAAV